MISLPIRIIAPKKKVVPLYIVKSKFEILLQYNLKSAPIFWGKMVLLHAKGG